MKLLDVLKRTRGRWHKNDPLDAFELLDQVEKRLGVPLPADYKWFLQFFADGAEGDFEDIYLQVLPLHEVADGYHLSDEMHQYVVFAVDGDDAFAFDTSRKRAAADYPVVRFSLASRDVDEIEDVAGNFADLITKLATGLP